MPLFSDTLVERLARAERVAVLTGAGISAESGVPTFRDPGGLWMQFKPEELANVEAFLRNPALVQGWYGYRQKLLQEVAPNPGHQALADLEALVPDFLLATQNVDGLHVRAGSRRVVELHGNIHRIYCVACGTVAPTPTFEVLAEGVPMHCTRCGGLLRPDVVWFGEMLPAKALEAANEAAAEADVFLSIGTSGLVYPAAALPLTAHAWGAYVAEINIEPSALADHFDEVVCGKAGEVLPALVTAVRRLKG